jgi:Rad3-related DNA helicase
MFFSDAQPKVLIIDEAHKLIPTLRLLISRRFSRTKYSWPKMDSIEQLADWSMEKAKDYEALGVLYKSRNDLRKAAINFSKAKNLRGLSKTVAANPDDFIYYEDKDDLVVEPVEVPRSIIEDVLGDATHIILMSATIPKRWAKQILGSRPFEYLELDSPIPKEQRKIVFYPAGLKASSEPAIIAAWVKKHQEQYHGNAVLHTTYSMGPRLVPYFQGAHLHTSGTKSATLKAFKQDGGLWIAAGVSEGIDLAGDLARLCLVPYLPFQNRESPLVKAVMARDPKAYFLETAIALVQQAGRTTRGPEDWSVTVVGDSRLPWLIKQVRYELPKYFIEAIEWR